MPVDPLVFHFFTEEMQKNANLLTKTLQWGGKTLDRGIDAVAGVKNVMKKIDAPTRTPTGFERVGQATRSLGVNPALLAGTGSYATVKGVSKMNENNRVAKGLSRPNVSGNITL